MYNHLGWWFPDAETHFPQMLAKSISKGGPAEYQYQVRNLSFQHVKSWNMAIDIGANVGLWARDLCKRFNKVMAFEPVDLFQQCLVLNVPAKNLEIQSVALGDQETTANMNITQGNTGHTHVDPASIGHGSTAVKTLDSFDLTQVDYIKMDCEGFEYRVIQGAKNTIQRARPIVVLEQKPHDMYSADYSQFAAIDLLQQLGMKKLGQVKDDWIMGW